MHRALRLWWHTAGQPPPDGRGMPVAALTAWQMWQSVAGRSGIFGTFLREGDRQQLDRLFQVGSLQSIQSTISHNAHPTSLHAHSFDHQFNLQYLRLHHPYCAMFDNLDCHYDLLGCVANCPADLNMISSKCVLFQQHISLKQTNSSSGQLRICPSAHPNLSF